MLDKSIPIPLYYQLKEKLKETILRGELAPGELLPSERELSERYGISRMTVRQALGEMERENLLFREQGIGTFVAEPKINQNLLRLTSFSEDMKARGHHPDSNVIGFSVRQASDAEAMKLGLTDDRRLAMIERIRLADQKPMAYEISHLPLQRFPGIEQVQLESISLYDLLKNQYQVTMKFAKQTIEAGVAKKRESELLALSVGAPVLLIERVTFDSKEQPFEWVRSIYRADRYKLQVELYR